MSVLRTRARDGSPLLLVVHLPRSGYCQVRGTALPHRKLQSQKNPACWATLTNLCMRQTLPGSTLPTLGPMRAHQTEDNLAPLLSAGAVGDVASPKRFRHRRTCPGALHLTMSFGRQNGKLSIPELQLLVPQGCSRTSLSDVFPSSQAWVNLSNMAAECHVMS